MPGAQTAAGLVIVTVGSGLTVTVTGLMSKHLAQLKAFLEEALG